MEFNLRFLRSTAIKRPKPRSSFRELNVQRSDENLKHLEQNLDSTTAVAKGFQRLIISINQISQTQKNVPASIINKQINPTNSILV